MTVTVGPVSGWAVVGVLAWLVVVGLVWLLLAASGRRRSGV
jgi:hypothetical protein